MFGIHHHGTNILETLPAIKLLADENKQCVNKKVSMPSNRKKEI